MVQRALQGVYRSSSVAGETVEAFVPSPLPPREPELRIEGDLAASLETAERAIGRLEVGAQLVPSLDWFLYSMVRKEALLSSQIEGTQSTLEDLFEQEQFGAVLDAGSDVDEVISYLDAVGYARRQLSRANGLPISTRLLNQTHRRLLSASRGAGKSPGRLRSSQNWIGGSRPASAVFVPPPPDAVPELMDALERYLHQDHELPPLIRIGMIHLQFETIHPYLDGNGRLGRLLIALLLEDWRLLPQPVLVASLELKRRRSEYYEWLGAVRRNGNWEGWLGFFLDSLAVSAEESLATIRRLFALTQSDRQAVLAASKSSLGAARLFEMLPQRPVLDIAAVMDMLETTRPTATAAVEGLVAAGVLAEIDSPRRGRVFGYRRYIDILSEDAEPIAG